MNKMLRVTMVLALALMVVFSMASVAFAAGSPSASDEIVDVVSAAGEHVAYTALDVDSSIPPLKPAAAKDLSVSEDEVIVLLEKDLKAEGTAPYDITFKAGAAGQTVYAYHYNGTAWERVGEGKGPQFTVTYKSLSPIGLVTLKDSSAPGGKSDKTGENNLPLYIAFAAVAVGAAAAGMALKKH
jgi:hypothetical protein